MLFRSEDSHHGEDNPLKKGDLVYLSTKNLSMPKGRARKLIPKFIGPYKILNGDSSASAYTLDLPEDLRKRGIHPTFHVNLLRRYEPNDVNLFPHRDTHVLYDLGDSDEVEWYVDELIGHRWSGKSLEFQVKWTLGDVTWEPLVECKDLEALDRYLELHGVDDWRRLPKRGTGGATRARAP